MINIVSIYMAGSLTILIALFHTRFYKRFGWEQEYWKLTSVNKRIFYTIHLALTILFFLCGIFTLWYANELSSNHGIAFGLNLGLSIFWLWRFIWQIFYFSKNRKNPVTLFLTFCFFLIFAGYTYPILNQ